MHAVMGSIERRDEVHRQRIGELQLRAPRGVSFPTRGRDARDEPTGVEAEHADIRRKAHWTDRARARDGNRLRELSSLLMQRLASIVRLYEPDVPALVEETAQERRKLRPE